LYEAVFAITESMISEYSVQGVVRERTGSSLPGISPSNTYSCRDGSYVIIAANADALFRRLMLAIDRRDLADDAQLAHNDGRVRRNDELDSAIGAWAIQHDSADVIRMLEQADVPVGRSFTAADIHENDHYNAREMLEKHDIPGGGPSMTVPGIVPKLSVTPGKTRWLGPNLGEHTQEVLKSLGLTNAVLQDLVSRGIV
jgi:formyl-CoA transferase